MNCKRMATNTSKVMVSGRGPALDCLDIVIIILMATPKDRQMRRYPKNDQNPCSQ